jgi:uncharacterized protein YebE (UPF0316 family)
MHIPIALNLLNLSPMVTPFLIFGARICDVSIGTVRIILIGRGHRVIASVLSFFEVLIWLIAIGQIVANLTDISNYIGYCAGYATGTFIGMTIERRLALGNLLVRVIVPHAAADLIVYLIAHNYRVTHVDGDGALGPVKVIFTIVKRNELNDVLTIIKRFDPDAFYTVEDVRMVSEKAPARGGNFSLTGLIAPGFWERKSK